MRLQKGEGNRWMLLGSKDAKVLNTHDFSEGSEFILSRNAKYIIQPDGSLRRINKKNRRGTTPVPGVAA